MARRHNLLMSWRQQAAQQQQQGCEKLLLIRRNLITTITVMILGLTVRRERASEPKKKSMPGRLALLWFGRVANRRSGLSVTSLSLSLSLPHLHAGQLLLLFLLHLALACSELARCSSTHESLRLCVCEFTCYNSYSCTTCSRPPPSSHISLCAGVQKSVYTGHKQSFVFALVNFVFNSHQATD